MNVDKKTKNFKYQIFTKDSLICRGKDLSISNEFFEEDDLFKEFKRSILKKGDFSMPNCSETLYFELEFLNIQNNLQNLEFRIKCNISVNQYKSTTVKL